MRAEFEERQKTNPVNGLLSVAQPNQSGVAGFDMAAFLAGSNKKESAAGSDSGPSKKEKGGRR